jgi:hypothetical protein
MFEQHILAYERHLPLQAALLIFMVSNYTLLSKETIYSKKMHHVYMEGFPIILQHLF